MSLTLLFVGAGPRTLGVLDRLSAHASATGAVVDVHVVDPHPAGAGRIWRADQHPLLWMNSRAADVTVHVIDYELDSLMPLAPAPGVPLSVTGTMAGRAFSTTTALRATPDEGSGERLWMPLVDGTERLGTLGLTFTDRVRGYSKMSMAVMAGEMALVSWWGIRDRFQRRRTT